MEREWDQAFGRSPSTQELAERLVISEAVLVDVIAYDLAMKLVAWP